MIGVPGVIQRFFRDSETLLFGFPWSAVLSGLLFLVMAASAQLHADQHVTEGSADVEIQQLVEVLENPESRDALVRQLKDLAQPAEVPLQDTADHPLIGSFLGVGNLDERLGELVNNFARLDTVISWIEETELQRNFWVDIIWMAAVAIGASLVVEGLCRAVAARRVRKLRERAVSGWLERPVTAIEWLSLELIPVVMFFVTASILISVVMPDPRQQAATTAIVHSYAIYRGATILARVLLAPLASQIRSIPIDSRQAAYLVVWFGRLAATAMSGMAVAGVLIALEAPPSASVTVMWLTGLAVSMMAIILILQSRVRVANWIRGDSGEKSIGVVRDQLADFWHLGSSAVVVVLFVSWSLDVGNSFFYFLESFVVTSIVLVAAFLSSSLLGQGLRKLFQIRSDLQQTFPGLEKRANRYMAAVKTVFQIAVWIVALTIILESWGVPATEIVFSSAFLGVAGRAISVVVIIAGGVFLWELGNGILDRYLSREGDSLTGKRLSSMRPLLRNSLLVTIVTIASIMVLREMGLDITTLLAGAGVVGIAIGFGAQSLVRDVITGIFIHVENQFAVGDWIDTGGKMGGVESMTIRTVTLRDLSGYVHTVPYGDISSLTNYMRDFGYAVIDIGIAYQENTDRVIDVIRDVDREARKDESFAEKLAGDLEVLGVNDLGDSSVTIRTRVRTQAGYQWGVRREYLRQIKLRFDEVGIEIPFPHMTVYFGELRDGKRTSPAIVRIDAADPPPVGQGT